MVESSFCLNFEFEKEEEEEGEDDEEEEEDEGLEEEGLDEEEEEEKEEEEAAPMACDGVSPLGNLSSTPIILNSRSLGLLKINSAISSASSSSKF